MTAKLNCTPGPDAIAEAVKRHADAIMRAAGSKLDRYTTRCRNDILAAAMDAWEEAYRAGADYAVDQMRVGGKTPSELVAENAQLREAFDAAERFFREAMPQINIGASAMDGNAIDAWNMAEIKIQRIRNALATTATGEA